MVMNYKLKYRLEFLMKYKSVSRIIYNKLERGLLQAYKTPQNMWKNMASASVFEYFIEKVPDCILSIVRVKFLGAKYSVCAKCIESTFEIYMLLM